MKAMRWAVVLLLLSLSLAVSAGALDELEALLTEFREEYGLNENNFSLCYRDTVTGEEYRFNDTAFLFAASTYKLPLNLYYYEQEQAGTLSPSAPVGGVPLSRAHYQSLVWSDNEVSHNMIYNLGSFRTYKEKMRKYFTMDDADIPYTYYSGNYYCTAMMLDTLQYLYERQENFPELLDYMKQAQPEEYFARYAGDTEVAHKYGFFYDEEEAVVTVNDVGIIYAPHPFLLAVYTKNAGDGVEVLARVCERLIQYNEEMYQEPKPTSEPMPESKPEPEPEPVKEPVPEPEPEPKPDPEPPTAVEPQRETVPEPETPPEAAAPTESDTPEESPEAIARRNIWWMVLVAAFIFLLADVGAFFWMRNGGLKRLEEKWGDEEEEDEEEEEENASL